MLLEIMSVAAAPADERDLYLHANHHGRYGRQDHEICGFSREWMTWILFLEKVPDATTSIERPFP